MKVPLVEKRNFQEKVIKQDKDVVLLLFTSQYPEDSDKNYNHHFADIFIHIKRKYEAEKVNSVKFYAIDLNLE